MLLLGDLYSFGLSLVYHKTKLKQLKSVLVKKKKKN